VSQPFGPLNPAAAKSASGGPAEITYPVGHPLWRPTPEDMERVDFFTMDPVTGELTGRGVTSRIALQNMIRGGHPVRELTQEERDAS